MTSRFWLACSLLSLFPLAVRADIGPRPPMRHREVDNAQDVLTMLYEHVSIRLAGHRAHVVVDFHFTTTRRQGNENITLRLGFPELRADRPLQNFAVQEAVSTEGFDQNGFAPVHDFITQPPGSGLSAGLQASWKTWSLMLQGSGGPPFNKDVRERVSYDQDLSPIGPGKWRFTYVLRSGAPWKGSIGQARVDLKLGQAQLLSAWPAGSHSAPGGRQWIMDNFEPTKDLVLNVRVTP